MAASIKWLSWENNSVIYKRKANYAWGKTVPRHQKLPAYYFTSKFRNVKYYLGNSKGEKVSHKPGPPWAKAQPKLNIMACFTDRNRTPRPLILLSIPLRDDTR